MKPTQTLKAPSALSDQQMQSTNRISNDEKHYEASKHANVVARKSNASHIRLKVTESHWFYLIPLFPLTACLPFHLVRIIILYVGASVSGKHSANCEL